MRGKDGGPVAERLLDIQNLSTTFRTEHGYMKAVDGVTLHADAGEILAVVGESGCGKSVTMQSVLRLYTEKNHTKYEGDIFCEGENLMKLPIRAMQKVRGRKIAMIFQDALSALDPIFTIGEQIIEPIVYHQRLPRAKAEEKAIEKLTQLGINEPEKRLKQYPFELSGGMRQRVMIAIALACDPALLIADEPTTALDVTIQAQIMDLIVGLNKQSGMGVILITHDLAVVAGTCSRAVVMYLGQVVEEADIETLFDHPSHPYTQGLIRSVPRIDLARLERLYMIPGTVPLLSQIPKGCRFAPRCSCARTVCHEEMPELDLIGPGLKVRCWFPGSWGAVGGI
jgi:oligopeptide/dipeptide ABC transporter ATP-binding protein